mmetsp:Transcript_7999/g.16065  ORF Transcript_7999/g.16065 Transcript_7999/m.16065 type:complete len:206 (+) Transcript_7999:756-1373(+)
MRGRSLLHGSVNVIELLEGVRNRNRSGGIHLLRFQIQIQIHIDHAPTPLHPLIKSKGLSNIHLRLSESIASHFQGRGARRRVLTGGGKAEFGGVEGGEAFWGMGRIEVVGRGGGGRVDDGRCGGGERCRRRRGRRHWSLGSIGTGSFVGNKRCRAWRPWRRDRIAVGIRSLCWLGCIVGFFIRHGAEKQRTLNELNCDDFKVNTI